MARWFPLEPRVRIKDLSLLGEARWTEVDAIASYWLRRRCVALPSVRVGLSWALQARGFSRHRDHVLLPRFVGRCIVNSISRVALPVEEPSSATRAAIVIDQFGLRQPLGALAREFQRRGWLYVEDSPYGVGEHEAPGPGSLGRFIGLAKVFPVAQGALLVTDDADIEQFIRTKRDEHSGWSAPVWLTMTALRLRQRAPNYSTAAEAAYELYVPARGGHRWMRGNIVAALNQAAWFEAETNARLAALTSALGDRALVPDLQRVPYVVPCFADRPHESARAALRAAGFDDTPMHVDVARNMLAPRYVAALLVPLNPRIPREAFDRLLRGLEKA